MIHARHLPVVLLIQLAAGAADAGTEPIGRLFFTPEYRNLLEKGRWSGESGHGGAPLHLDGVVVRSRGGVTLWIDQRVWREEPVAVTPNVPERATIRTRDGAPASLRVGESVDPVTADTRDRLSGGRIVVHKR